MRACPVAVRIKKRGNVYLVIGRKTSMECATFDEAWKAQHSVLRREEVVMRVSRAKRRLVRWYRYVQRTGSVCNNSRYAQYHRGHIDAYADVTFAKRWVPKGIRAPWSPTSRPGNERNRNAS